MPKTAVLAPGLHAFPTYQQRVGSHEFAHAVLSHIPEGIFYRKAGVVGRILEDDFVPLVASQAKLLIDEHVEIELHSLRQNKEHVQYLPCSNDNAQLVLDALTCAPYDGMGFQLASVGDKKLRLLRAVAPHPVITPSGKILGPGWHPWYGILVTWAGVEAPPEDPAELFSDFALDPVSYANCLALILTVWSRPALDGNVPLFVLTAPVAGSGKTKMLDELIGAIAIGRAVPSMIWPDEREEVRKTITAAMMSGSQLLNLDNVPRVLDSDALASFLTTSAWRDRILGKSQSVEIPNTLTLAATGNHIQASGELARRSVRIELNPNCDAPELRNGWKFPLLRSETMKRRDGLIAWFLARVKAWVDAGRPSANVALGSFEGWSACVVDILRHAGYRVVFELRLSMTTLDVDRTEIERVLEEWWTMHGDQPVYPSHVLAVANRVEAWQALISSKHGDRGQATAVGYKLSRLAGRVIGKFIILANETRLGRAYRLEVRAPDKGPQTEVAAT